MEVAGLGDYLPRYAGNLDIMTAAATRTAEMFAEEILAGKIQLEAEEVARERVDQPEGTKDPPARHVPARRHARQDANRFRVEQMVTVAPALDEAGVPLIQVTHGAGARRQLAAARLCPA